jgi:hypothetical protein
MPQQVINIGSAPNDGTGDPLRTAFDKCNDNFTELYSGGGGGSGSVSSVSVVAANGVSGVVANPTTTPAITLTLGAITPATVNGITMLGALSPQLTVIGTSAVTGNNTGDQNLFSKIAVAGEADVVADSPTDTLTLVAGANVILTTNATNDEITISSTGGGGGGAPINADYLVRTANASLTAERVVTDSTSVTANWSTAGQVAFERAALTGDVIASANSNSTTIDANKVTYSKFQQIPALSVVANGGSTAANVSSVSGTAGQVLRVNDSGNTLAFGAINLATAGSITGTLGLANGGTGLSGAGSNNQVLVTNGIAASWGQVSLSAGVTGDLPLSNLAQASAASILLGRGAGAGAGDFQEITLGTNLSMTGTVLNASGGSGGGNVSGPASPTTDNALVRWDGTTGTLIKNSGVTLSNTQEMSGLKSLTFNTAGGTVGLAKMVWDTTNQTIDLGIGAGSVNALLGVDSHVLGRNTTGSTINRGEVVRVNGASAGNLTIALAQGNTDPNTANTIGIAAETISNNATGMVITSGLLRDLNTSTFSAGDLLYISPTTPGLLVNTIPSAPNHAVRMGYVVSAHPSNGIIYVAVNNGYELNELHDVNYPTAPATNDFLVYVTNRWENQTPAAARTSMGLGTLATQSGTFSGTSSGTNTGDQTITLTGDVTGTGTGSFATTIGANKVQYSMIQQVAGLSVIGNGGSTMANSAAITGTAGQVLRVDAGGSALAFGALSLSTAASITGTLGIANGGTGQTTAVAAFDALAPTTTKGDIIVSDGTDNVRLAVGGTNGHVLTVDSTTATGVKWAAVSASGGGSTNVWIPAAQWIPRTTTGCGIDSREQATGNINTDELLFDLATIEYAQAMVVMPSNYNNGTVTARFYWTASTGTASTTVTWAIRGRAFGDNVALGQTFTNAAQSVTDTYFSANQMHISGATGSVSIDGTPAANKPIIFEIYRDTADTLNADARLLGVEISYTA